MIWRGRSKNLAGCRWGVLQAAGPCSALSLISGISATAWGRAEEEGAAGGAVRDDGGMTVG